MSRHERAILQLSGGKDSIAVLEAAAPFGEAITAVYCDMGDSFPHVLDYVVQACNDRRILLGLIGPDTSVLDYIQETGLPSDMVPVWATRFGRKLTQTVGDCLQSGIECCSRNLWQPMAQYVAESGATLVLRGSKQHDDHVTVASGHVEDGIEYISPFWDFTDTEILAWLAERDVALPMQYGMGCVHSLDCMHCTAWGNTEHEVQRVRFTREVYPEVYQELRERAQRVAAVLDESIESVRPFFEELQ
jgi:3'-phosphoadenosine 5'-phosphosulfate sulfotransferase (PAPS reductase)/FAD synthetase